MDVCIYMYVNIVNVCIFTIIIRIVSYRIENNHIVSLCIDTYRIVWWPYRLIPSKNDEIGSQRYINALYEKIGVKFSVINVIWHAVCE